MALTRRSKEFQEDEEVKNEKNPKSQSHLSLRNRIQIVVSEYLDGFGLFLIMICQTSLVDSIDLFDTDVALRQDSNEFVTHQLNSPIDQAEPNNLNNFSKLRICTRSKDSVPDYFSFARSCLFVNILYSLASSAFQIDHSLFNHIQALMDSPSKKIGFLEHFPLHASRYPDLTPYFLRWDDINFFYYVDKASNIFNTISYVLQDETYEDVENLLVAKPATALLDYEDKNMLDKGYRQYNKNSYLYVQHINEVSVKSSSLILQPVIHEQHWTLLVGRLNEKIWEFYDFLPNPKHKQILPKIINTKGTFYSDIRCCLVHIVRGLPTQSNSYDCGIVDL
ncbi:hypothetical protein IEQ34_002691 [Dendrobium chrysotoxum]|uniref:Ubiquitin-like protease family profile domain-containing protein n=1 Tax=Dendrobium chrysotoxum TaxID=161865 RepID=A0AAV7HJQ0_DENCH|nr:hypothetical protein IEQ34_002691 [Dendrobium chrysotoxum]